MQACIKHAHGGDMDTSLNSALTRLARGEMLRVHDGQGRGIAVFRGQVWITQDGDVRDVVLGAGESFTFDRPGLAIVQALADTSVLLFGSDATSPPDGGSAAAARAQSDATASVRTRISSYELHRAARRTRSAAVGGAVTSLFAVLRRLGSRLRSRTAGHADLGARLAASGAGAAMGGADHGLRA
jgi:hypothetical protein